MKNKLTHLALFVALALHPVLAQSQKADFVKNSVQIGKTGYYFDQENPFGFGDLTYLPYLGYTRKFTPTFGMRVSVEHYEACYLCQDYPRSGYPPAFEILYRSFKHLQLNFLYEYAASNRLSLILAGGPGYRWDSWGESWYPHQYSPWTDNFEVDARSFHEWGIGGALEIKYKVYKQFSLSVKGEYFNFPASPIQQFGAGAYLGYDF